VPIVLDLEIQMLPVLSRGSTLRAIRYSNFSHGCRYPTMSEGYFTWLVRTGVTILFFFVVLGYRPIICELVDH